MKKNRGSSTVVLAIILPVIFLFVIVLLDAARILYAKNMTKEFNDRALEALLSDYNQILFEKYGLFGQYNKDTAFYEPKTKVYLEKNIPQNKNDIFAYSVDALKVNSNNNLSDSNELEKQILAYMKYRAPAGIVDNFIQKAGLLNSAEKKLKTISNKLNLDKRLNKLDSIKTSFNNRFKNINNKYDDLKKDIQELASFDNLQKIDLSQINQAICMSIELTNKVLNEVESFQNELEIANKETNNFFKEAENNDFLNSSYSDVFTSNKIEIDKKIKVIVSNIQVLDDLKKLFDDKEELKNKESDFFIKINKFIEQSSKLNSLSALGNENINSEEWLEDPRNYIASQAEAIILKGISKFTGLEMLNNVTNYVDQLPSKGVLLSTMDFSNNNVDFQNDFSQNNGFSQNVLEVVGKNVKSIDGTDLIQSSYLGEYVLTQFKFRTKEAKESQMLKTEGFFDKYEVEYIINGDLSEENNKKSIENKILLTRFALNTVYIYTDKTKNQAALTAATVSAGWTGIGVPLLHSFIMLSWSMAESILDLKDIDSGKAVPLYKSTKTWKLNSLNAVKDSIKKAVNGENANQSLTNNENTNMSNDSENSSLNQMSYKDYLFLYLFLTPNDVKLKRIMDVIQLNMVQLTGDNNFNLSQCSTNLSLDSCISIKRLIIPSLYNNKNRQTFLVSSNEKYN